MSEYDIIRSLSKVFKRSPLQKNGLFECDAEIIELDGKLWALTIDEFTPEEDLFTSEDPEMLGANLVTATLSDLLAAGANPEWFMHTVSLQKNIDESFLSKLSIGINSVLSEAGCSLCGGDIGCADTWRFCGFAMGQVPENRPLTRIIPCMPQKLWVTGKLGDANLAALTGAPTPRFEFRINEAKAIRNIATACIDTSGGFFDALWLLHDLNQSLRFDINLDNLPVAHGVKAAATALGFPKEAALLGGAGEYELLFTMPSEFGDPEIDATCIGIIKPDKELGLYLDSGEKLLTEMVKPPPCPRDALNIKDHIQDVMLMAKLMFNRDEN